MIGAFAPLLHLGAAFALAQGTFGAFCSKSRRKLLIFR